MSYISNHFATEFTVYENPEKLDEVLIAHIYNNIRTCNVTGFDVVT